MRLGERPAEDGEVLRIDEDQPSVDATVAAHDTVAEVSLLVEAEVGGPMRDERIQLDERSLIEEEVDPFARGQLVAIVLLADAILTAAESRLLAEPSEVRKLVGRRHGGVLRAGVGPGRDRTSDPPVMSRML